MLQEAVGKVFSLFLLSICPVEEIAVLFRTGRQAWETSEAI